MVMGEDVSRWELNLQNLNILMLGEVCGAPGVGEGRLREGEVLPFLAQGCTAVLGTSQKACFLLLS